MFIPPLPSNPPSPGIIQDRSTQVRGEIRNLLSRRAYPLKNLELLNTIKDPESWSRAIIEALLGNLTYAGSQNGQFGTPDNDIIRVVISSHQERWVWIKILGVKLDTLALNVTGKIPNNQIQRIHTIQKVLKSKFTIPSSPI